MKQYTKLKSVRLKGNADYDEAWLQEVIANDPSVLGLGPLSVKDRERTHKGAGRLDMLLQDEELSRYEVELQLGASDETHIIRTIEYWDRERKLYPQYDHTAVIVAEDITSRFLNVISLFNGHIPIIAIQLTAIQTSEGVGLVFTKVLDTVKLGLVDEDETTSEATDRGYWESQKATPDTMKLADSILGIARTIDKGLEQSYKKNYIGFKLGNRAFNFAVCKPRAQGMHLEISLPQSEEIDAELKKTGLDVLSYNRHFGLYRISLKQGEIESHKDYITTLLKKAYEERA
jgi:predicted transport protein